MLNPLPESLINLIICFTIVAITTINTIALAITNGGLRRATTHRDLLLSSLLNIRWVRKFDFGGARGKSAPVGSRVSVTTDNTVTVNNSPSTI